MRHGDLARFSGRIFRLCRAKQPAAATGECRRLCPLGDMKGGLAVHVGGRQYQALARPDELRRVALPYNPELPE